MGYLSVVGASLLLSGAFILCRMTFRYYDRVCSCYADLLKLMYVLRQKIGTSSLSVSQILETEEGYSVLGETQFLIIAKDEGIARAFNKCEKDMPIDKEDKQILKRYFAKFGSEMISAELENLNMAIESLEAKYEKIKAENPPKKKIGSTMIVCFALMVIILII